MYFVTAIQYPNVSFNIQYPFNDNGLILKTHLLITKGNYRIRSEDFVVEDSIIILLNPRMKVIRHNESEQNIL